MFKKILSLLVLSVVAFLIAQPAKAQTAPPQFVELELTSSQLSSLISSPVTLVPAPGAGFAIQPLGMFLHYKFGSTPYTDPTEGASLRVINGGLITQVEQWIPFVTASSDQIAQFYFQTPQVLPRSTQENQPVVLKTNARGAGNDLTGGDGTLVVRFYYYVQAL